jgi:uncharacterized MAPEG superfamily protein
MPTAVQFLVLTAGLGIVLWIPHVVGMVMTNGMLKPADYRDITPKPVPPWVQRANRVVGNYAENIAPFAILVIVAYIRYRQAEPSLLATIGIWAQVFFWARVVHAVVYWFGIPYVRTLAFVVGVVATGAIFLLMF